MQKTRKIIKQKYGGSTRSYHHDIGNKDLDATTLNIVGQYLRGLTSPQDRGAICAYEFDIKTHIAKKIKEYVNNEYVGFYEHNKYKNWGVFSNSKYEKTKDEKNEIMLRLFHYYKLDRVKFDRNPLSKQLEDLGERLRQSRDNLQRLKFEIYYDEHEEEKMKEMINEFNKFIDKIVNYHLILVKLPQENVPNYFLSTNEEIKSTINDFSNSFEKKFGDYLGSENIVKLYKNLNNVLDSFKIQILSIFEGIAKIIHDYVVYFSKYYEERSNRFLVDALCSKDYGIGSNFYEYINDVDFLVKEYEKLKTLKNNHITHYDILDMSFGINGKRRFKYFKLPTDLMSDKDVEDKIEKIRNFAKDQKKNKKGGKKQIRTRTRKIRK
jgi:hypothetical protein